MQILCQKSSVFQEILYLSTIFENYLESSTSTSPDGSVGLPVRYRHFCPAADAIKEKQMIHEKNRG